MHPSTINFQSTHFKYAGQTIKWLSPDSEELYHFNLKNRYKDLLSNGWIDNHFDYTFNQHGFRCKEFTNEDCIMFLGCSLTAGVGVPVHCRWTDILAQNLNLACYNFGINGSSCDTAFRLCLGYINRINPKIVIFCKPPGIRLEVVTPNEIINYGRWNMLTTASSFMIHYISDDTNNYLNYMKNILAIEHLCKLRNIKFFYDAEPFYDCALDFGRDLMHYGIKSNYKFAHRLLEMLQV